MERVWVAALTALALAGCITADAPDTCPDEGTPTTLHFGPDYTLVPEAPGEGHEVGNGFVEAFLTDDMDEWRAAPAAEGYVIHGNVTIDYWIRYADGAAPIVIGRDAGEGYHFFNQFGSDRGFMPAYAIENGPVLRRAGEVQGYHEVLDAPPGGFVVEEGDSLRLLLTNLLVDAPTGTDQQVLFGSDTPSGITFTAWCRDAAATGPAREVHADILFVANQGLLTGALPESPLNHAAFRLQWEGPIDRITIELTQTGDPNPLKDDVDMTLVAPNGTWSGGSPYSNEIVTLWPENLAALGALDGQAGSLQILVDSYSGAAYEGLLSVRIDGPGLVAAGLEPA